MTAILAWRNAIKNAAAARPRTRMYTKTTTGRGDGAGGGGGVAPSGGVGFGLNPLHQFLSFLNSPPRLSSFNSPTTAPINVVKAVIMVTRWSTVIDGIS